MERGRGLCLGHVPKCTRLSLRLSLGLKVMGGESCQNSAMRTIFGHAFLRVERRDSSRAFYRVEGRFTDWRGVARKRSGSEWIRASSRGGSGATSGGAWHDMRVNWASGSEPVSPDTVSFLNVSTRFYLGARRPRGEKYRNNCVWIWIEEIGSTNTAFLRKGRYGTTRLSQRRARGPIRR